MGKISQFKISNIANDAFRTLFVRIHQEVEGLSSCKRKTVFEEAWQAFEKAMDDSTKWRRSLKDYDDDCDKVWILLMAQTRASALHFDPKRSAAAAKVDAILDSIGNVTRLPYTKEYALIRKALNQLAELDEAVLKDALVDDIVLRLRDAYDMFMAAQQDENSQRASYQLGVVRDARNTLTQAWSDYAALLEIQADDDPLVAIAIDRINQCISEIRQPNTPKSPSASPKTDAE